MEALWDKIGAIVAAIISVLGGFYMYDRTTTHNRISKLESESAKQRTDIEVIKVQFHELKADTNEIKQSQKDIINLLTKRRK